MSALAVSFEVFDPDDVAEIGALSRNAVIKQACDAAYQQGYRDGESAAKSTRETGDSEILARIGEAADDFALTHAEAHAIVLRSLRPLIAELTGAVLPACARAGFADEVADVVADLARDSKGAKITVHVAPDRLADLAAKIDASGIAVELLSDPQISGLLARISAGDGTEKLDLESAMSEALRAVEGFFKAADEEQQNAG